MNIQSAERIAREHVSACGALMIRKGDLPGMAAVRAIFDALKAFGVGVPSGAELDRYSHAIGPFVLIADDLQGADLLEVVAHECEHSLQFARGEYRKGSTAGATLDGGASMAWLYLVEPEARVRYEARAFRAGLEVRHALGLPLPSIETLGDALARGYALDATHVGFGMELFEVALRSVQGGIYTTESGTRIVASLRLAGVIS